MYNPEDFGAKLKWWGMPVDESHREIIALIRQLEAAQQGRTQNNLRNLRMYGDVDMIGTSPFLFAAHAQANRVFRTSWNVVKSVADTLQAKVAKNKVKPTFLTDGGDYKKQKKAKSLDKALLGFFYAGKLYEIMPRVFLDACIFDAGVVKVFSEGTKIVYERVLSEEIRVDDFDGIYGTPRNLYQCRYMDRSALAYLYPDHAAKIKTAAQVVDTSGSSRATDMVRLVEAFHLPSDENSDDGRHVICVDTVTLLDQPWTRDHFPFVFYHWSKLPFGFWGRSVADELCGIQIEINKTLLNIQNAIGLMSAPKVLIETGSKVAQGKLNNETGAVWRYTGIKPEIIAPTPISGQVFQWVEELYAKAYELIGISGTTAQGTKPSYELSGKAVREYNDIESERFVQHSLQYEDAFMAIADLTIFEAREIAKKHPGWQISTFNTKSGMEDLKWSEINLEKDEFVLQRFPTSALSQTPAVRMQQVQELVGAGYVDATQAAELLDFPDIDQWKNIKYANFHLADKVLSKMLDGDKYSAPEPYMDLQLTRTMAQQYYLKAQVDGLPDEVQDNLRNFIDAVQDLIDKAAGTPPPPPAMGGNPAGDASNAAGVADAAAQMQPAFTNAPTPEAAGVIAPSLQPAPQ